MNGKLTLVLFAALVAVASAGNLGYGSGQRYGGSRHNFGVGRGSGLGIGHGSSLGFGRGGVHRQGGQQYYQSYRPSYSGHRRYRRSASGLNYGRYGSGFGRGGQSYYPRPQSFYRTNSYRRPSYNQYGNSQYYH